MTPAARLRDHRARPARPTPSACSRSSPGSGCRCGSSCPAHGLRLLKDECGIASLAELERRTGAVEDRRGVRRRRPGRPAGVRLGEDRGDGGVPVLDGHGGGDRARHQPEPHRAGGGRDAQGAAAAAPRAAGGAALADPPAEPGGGRRGGRDGDPGGAGLLPPADARGGAGGLRGAAGARPPRRRGGAGAAVVGQAGPARAGRGAGEARHHRRHPRRCCAPRCWRCSREVDLHPPRRRRRRPGRPATGWRRSRR